MPTPVVLHLEDAIKYNHKFYEQQFSSNFEVVRDDTTSREGFIDALKNNRFGNFSAIFRPHFQTGGEMGQWDDELIAYLPPSVSIFASAGAGFNWADTEALAKREIWYANSAGAPDEAVADAALCMIKQLGLLATSPIIHEGPILGIVGSGGISKKLAWRAQAIRMEAHYFDLVRQTKDEERRLQITYHDSLASLLGVSDYVSLHTPLNAHTKHLINADTIKQMKDGARLINTARGEVVEEEALVAALKSGELLAAGLDVHYHEPQVTKELAQMKNATLTTHNGGGAVEMRVNFGLGSMKNTLDVVGNNGEYRGEPRTSVNKKWFVAAERP